MSTTQRLEQILPQCYTVQEVARRLGRSETWVRELFENEPGVLVSGAGHRRGKRRYVTLTIPEPVLLRVIKGMQR